MAACGAGGSALLPFITGTMASNLGIESLQPLCVFQLSLPMLFPDSNIYLFHRLLAMMIILGLVWGFVPKRRKMTLEDF
jgi:hypothetical protein